MGRKGPGIARGVRVRTYPSGRRVFEIQFPYKGVTCREILRTFDPDKPSNVKAVNNLRSEIMSRIERGTFDYQDFFPNSKTARLFGAVVSRRTVKAAQEELISDLERAGLEKTTIASYRRSAGRINDMIGTIMLHELTAADFRQMLRDRAVTRKTWNNDLLPLRRALKRAVADGEMQFSPLDRVDLNEFVPKHKKPGPDPFSLDEIDRIIKTAAAYCERFHNLAEFAFFSGMRPEELAGLQWSDVANGTVTVTGAAQLSLKSAELKQPKTAAGARTINLLDRAQSALERQKRLTWFRGKNVFCRVNSLQPFSSYEQIRQRWTTILERAGVRYRPFNQCRHTYASHMLSSGLNPLYVAAQMGHRGTAMLDVYAKWVNEWKEESGEYGNKIAR